MPDSEMNWERIDTIDPDPEDMDASCVDVYRAPVEGGNLYLAAGDGALALTFVPRPVPRPVPIDPDTVMVMGVDKAVPGADRTVARSIAVIACPTCLAKNQVALGDDDAVCNVCNARLFGGGS